MVIKFVLSSHMALAIITAIALMISLSLPSGAKSASSIDRVTVANQVNTICAKNL